MPPLTASQLLFIARQHLEAGRVSEAESLCRKIIAGDPACAAALHLAATIAERSGRVQVACGFLRRAAAAEPGNAAIAHDLERIVELAGEQERVAARREESTARKAQGCFVAGNQLHRDRDVDGAISAYRQALAHDPNHVAAMNNLSLALKDAGALDEAIAWSRKAVRSHPNNSACHGNLLYSLHFDPDSDAASLFTEHQAWAQRHADPLRAEILPHENERSPDRRLRIGYVSPNFNVHPVGRFLTQLLSHHDHDRFEIVCYSGVRRPDALTEQFKRWADVWVDAALMPDAALANKIRDDRIDILIDLTMHMADSRLLVFARKPAPIQATYLAYCSTTGLRTIDYRFTDPHLDPPGGDGACYSEKSAWLGESYWCYDPVIEAPEVNSLPAIASGHVTFASLNNFCKASPAALNLWAQLLKPVPGARLILHAHPGAHRDRTRERFAAQGVDPGRLEFFDLLPLADYFALHQRIDIALDSFPYPGGTTTCDAMWMGVPTVSLVGGPACTRSGLSILSNAGVAELAAQSTEEYLRTVIELANNLPRLAELRASLRDRMRNSPLMDGARFAREVEKAYRSWWRMYVDAG